MKTQLNPVGANQTEVTLETGVTVLYSYKTPVAAYIPGAGRVYETETKYSVTTTRHIGQFVARHTKHGERADVPQRVIDNLASGSVQATKGGAS